MPCNIRAKRSFAFTFIFIIFASFLYLPSCAISFAHYRRVEGYLSNGDYLSAAKMVEKLRAEYGEKNSLLYYLDLGILYHLAGEYSLSNEYFTRAEERGDELYTKSISKEAASLLTSDNAKPFEGEEFERVLINLFMALNYVFLNKFDEALVEARKVNHRLEVYNLYYGGKKSYRDDAFVRYIMGMLYENSGEINDSFISYRKALNAYKVYSTNYGTKVPDALIADCIRTGRAMGFYEEIEEIKKEFPEYTYSWPEKGGNLDKRGEVVFIHLNGLAPEKIERRLQIALINGLPYVRSAEVSSDEQADVNKALDLAGSLAGDLNISVAFPEFKNREYTFRGSTIEEPLSQSIVKTYTAEDIEKIAIKDLNERMGRIMGKTIARAVVKYVLAYAGGSAVERTAKKKMGKESGAVVGWLAKKALASAASLTENADRRSWQLLPAEFRLARLRLSPGVHNLILKFYDRYGNVMLEKNITNVRVEAGKRTFIEFATMR